LAYFILLNSTATRLLEQNSGTWQMVSFASVSLPSFSQRKEADFGFACKISLVIHL